MLLLLVVVVVLLLLLVVVLLLMLVLVLLLPLLTLPLPHSTPEWELSQCWAFMQLCQQLMNEEADGHMLLLRYVLLSLRHLLPLPLLPPLLLLLLLLPLLLTTTLQVRHSALLE